MFKHFDVEIKEQSDLVSEYFQIRKNLAELAQGSPLIPLPRSLRHLPKDQGDRRSRVVCPYKAMEAELLYRIEPHIRVLYYKYLQNKFG